MSRESTPDLSEITSTTPSGMENGRARIIKRYSNRKLYDQHDSSYVSLHDIEQLICSGKNVVVIENETGREVTGVTLAQIIIEQQKRDGVQGERKYAPVAFLTRLIRSSEDVLPQLRRGIPKKNPLIVLQQSVADWRDRIEQSIKILRSKAGDDVARDAALRDIRQQLRDIECRVEKIASTDEII